MGSEERKTVRGEPVGRGTSHSALVLRLLNNWHLGQLPNQVRSEELGVRSECTAHKMRKRRGVLYHEGILGHSMNGVPLPALLGKH